MILPVARSNQQRNDEQLPKARHDAAAVSPCLDTIDEVYDSIWQEIPELRRESIAQAQFRTRSSLTHLLFLMKEGYTDTVKQCETMRAELRERSMRAFATAAENLKAEDYWGFFGKIAGAASSTLSIVFGVSTIASGGSLLPIIAGGVLLFAGAASFVKLVVDELHGWDRLAGCLAGGDPLKKAAKLEQIQRWTAISLVVLSLLGYCAGVATVNVHGLQSAITGAIGVLMQISQGTFEAASGFSLIGKSYYQYNRKLAEIEIDELETKATAKRQAIEEALDRVRELLDIWKRSTQRTYQETLTLHAELFEIIERALLLSQR